MLSLIISIAILGVICYQDLRFRSIHWVTIPLLFAALVFHQLPNIELKSIALNLGFLGFLLGGLYLYLKIRKQGKINLLKDYFGLGDVLFLIALTPLIRFPFFVHFFTVGTLFTLFCFGISMLFKKNALIPFAGYFAIYTCIYLLLSFRNLDVIMLDKLGVLQFISL
jgi:hypothetical protein